MDVRGKLVKPGMHWYLPGRDAGMYYVANIVEMDGRILDKKLRGFICFDPIHMYQGGEQWEFIPDPRGRLIGLGKLKNPQVDGRWRRVGDTREPEVWFAWGEAAPGHGSRPANRLAGKGQRISVNFAKY